MRPFLTICMLCCLFAATLTWGGCDSDIAGTASENQPPETELSVRDASLVDNLENADRLSSTVDASWSGTDADGFVTAFELRFFDEGSQPGPEEGWMTTTRQDSLILLPIPRGQRTANVIFEVRAIDNENVKDPTPARTVFPIQNAPPSIRFESFNLPPDTTFTIFSFSWTANDPEGAANLERIEVSFNDSTSFVALSPETEFITLAGEIDRTDPTQTQTDARLFVGRGYQRTETQLPNLRLDAENTFYLRAVDQTDTTSTLQRHTWFVKKPQGDVLFVNDYRKSTAPTVQAFHLNLLKDYLPPNTAVDIWDISLPVGTGSSGNLTRSDFMPSTADPTLRQTFTLYDYIYWVSTNTTNSIQGNNLPFAANVMDLFFEEGGKLIVHTPITLPADPASNLGNPAVLLLPLSDLITFPDSLRQSLRLPRGASISPVEPLPGVSDPLPALVSDQFLITTLPFIAEGSTTIPLYEAEYRSVSQSGSQGDWLGPSTVVSISADQRVGLFAMPLVNEQTGEPILIGENGNPDDAVRAVHLMLESLGFPKR